MSDFARDMLKWVAVVGAAISLGIAGLGWSVGPASECSTPQLLHFSLGLLPFGLFAAVGAYVIARGSVAQRLTLFAASTIIFIGYVWGLSLSLPMVFATEISCAADGNR